MDENALFHKPVIVLDAGKVLVDFELDIFFSRISWRLGKTITPQQAATVIDLYSPMEWGGRSEKAAARALNDIFALSLDSREWGRLWCSIFTGETPGMRAALTRVKDRFTLVGLSNTIEAHWAYILAKYPVFGLLDGWVVSYIEGVTKPNPAIYRIVEDRFCNGGAPFFFTDDIEENVVTARKLGWDAEVFNGAMHFEAEIARRCGRQ